MELYDTWYIFFNFCFNCKKWNCHFQEGFHRGLLPVCLNSAELKYFLMGARGEVPLPTQLFLP